MEKQVYPVILSPENDGGYLVYIPDFDAHTAGNNLADAVYMAKDAISALGLAKEDLGQDIPLPTGVIPICGKDGKIVFVDVDFDEYRMLHDNKKVNTMLTIRSWIKKRAEKEKINLSSTLEEAILAKTSK